ncbi:hypothetical protein F5146DRAFT_645713 [Armillaria mellea]|nr:hypothetical protein F5146DRAFT_645713 [Armillaria mellea]
MVAVVSVCLPVSSVLFSRSVRLYSLVARRWPPLKHHSRIQGQDSSSLEVLAEVRSSLCFVEILIGHEPCNALNVHIDDIRVLLEPAGSIRKYQEDQEIYNGGYMLLSSGIPFVRLSSISLSLHWREVMKTSEYLLSLFFEMRVAAESIYVQDIDGAVVSIPSFYVTDFQRRVLHSPVSANPEVRQIIPVGTAVTLAHRYPSKGNKSIDYCLLICTKERCGIQFYDDGYDEIPKIADDLHGEGMIEELLEGAGILGRDKLHVIIIDEPPPVLRQQVEVSFPRKILPPDPYAIVRGAVLKAKWLSEPEVTCAMSIIPFGLGEQLSDGIFGPVIMRNTLIPKQA